MLQGEPAFPGDSDEFGQLQKIWGVRALVHANTAIANAATAKMANANTANTANDSTATDKTVNGNTVNTTNSTITANANVANANTVNANTATPTAMTTEKLMRNVVSLQVLGFPSEDSWPGVSLLPNYKPGELAPPTLPAQTNNEKVV